MQASPLSPFNSYIERTSLHNSHIWYTPVHKAILHTSPCMYTHSYVLYLLCTAYPAYLILGHFILLSCLPCAASTCPNLSPALSSPTLTSILSTLAPLLSPLPNTSHVGQKQEVEEQGPRTASPISVSHAGFGSSSLQPTQGQVIVDGKDVRLHLAHTHPHVAHTSVKLNSWKR